MEREDYDLLRKLLIKYGIHTILSEMCNHMHAVGDKRELDTQEQHDKTVLVRASNETYVKTG